MASVTEAADDSDGNMAKKMKKMTLEEEPKLTSDEQYGMQLMTMIKEDVFAR